MSKEEKGFFLKRIEEREFTYLSLMNLAVDLGDEELYNDYFEKYSMYRERREFLYEQNKPTLH